MDVNLFAHEEQPSSTENTNALSDAQVEKRQKKYIKGCGKIYHQPGVMTAKGDALYDFTCNFSHRCPSCESNHRKYYFISSGRKEQKIKQENKARTEKNLEMFRKKYFSGQPGCGCKKDHMCGPCLAVLQAEVTRCETGCGATWEEEFGGMAAGPAWVTCADNYFLCQQCSRPLGYIKRLQKQHPHVKLDHIPEKTMYR